MRLLWNLLRSNVSVGQLVGFFLADFIGLAIVLFGACLYWDITPLLKGENKVFNPNYIIAYKPVSELSVLTGARDSFSEEEIADLQAQDFVKSVGSFTPASFSVYASIDASSFGMKLSTELFFESVEDAFLDTVPLEWDCPVPCDTIPVIVPRDYINLYNFGFSQGAGLPAISENIIRDVCFEVALSGDRRISHFVGRIVGFSDRLNTILIPQKVMDWANGYLSYSNRPTQPSRLIVEVANPADSRIHDYFDEHDYYYNTDSADSGRAGWLLGLLVSVVMGVGLVISLLACYILILSVSLLLHKNSDKLRDLKLIGCSTKMVALPYQILAAGVNLASFLIAVVVALFVRSLYISAMTEHVPDYESVSIALPMLGVLAFVLAVTLMHVLSIRSRIKKL